MPEIVLPLGPAEPEKPGVSREVREEYDRMLRRMERVRARVHDNHGSVGKALRDEEEVLRASIAHFERRYGLAR